MLADVAVFPAHVLESPAEADLDHQARFTITDGRVVWARP
jgi:hypothetical protein